MANSSTDPRKTGGASPSADAGRSTAATLVIPALLALSFALRALVCLRSVENLDGITIPDDCFYTLHIARSIARGLGPMYGQHASNGFQPLFGFLMVPSFWIFHDPLSPVRVALVVGALADTVALWFLARLLLAATRRPLVVGMVMLLQDAHEAMRQGRLFAHAKEAHVEYLLVWGDTMDLIRSESHDWRDDDVIHERDITEFQTTHKPWHVYRVRP